MVKNMVSDICYMISLANIIAIQRVIIVVQPAAIRVARICVIKDFQCMAGKKVSNGLYVILWGRKIHSSFSNGGIRIKD